MSPAKKSSKLNTSMKPSKKNSTKKELKRGVQIAPPDQMGHTKKNEAKNLQKKNNGMHSGDSTEVKKHDFCAYLSGLASDSTEKDVMILFNKFSLANAFKPKQIAIKNKSGNFCFVFFSESSTLSGILSEKHTTDGVKIAISQLDNPSKKRKYESDEENAVPRKKFAGMPEKTAYVGSLDPATLEDTVKNHFTKYGEIEGVVVLGKQGSSKGFGFVTFVNKEDMEKALKDKHRIDDKDVRIHRKLMPKGIEIKQKQPIKNDNEVIVHLNPSIPKTDFTKYFEEIGNVKSITFPMNKKSKKPKGFAFVSFTDKDTFEKVISSSHVIKSYKVFVKSADKHQKSSNENEKMNGSKSSKTKENEIMVRFNSSITRDELHSYFEGIGKVDVLTFPTAKTEDGERKSKGFAFLNFVDESSYKQALDMSHEINGHQLTVRNSKTKYETVKYQNEIMVRNLPKEYTRNEVEEIFSKYGKVLNVNLPLIERGNAQMGIRGFGFIAFESAKTMKKVLKVPKLMVGDLILKIEAAKGSMKDGKKVEDLDDEEDLKMDVNEDSDESEGEQESDGEEQEESDGEEQEESDGEEQEESDGEEQEESDGEEQEESDGEEQEESDGEEQEESDGEEQEESDGEEQEESDGEEQEESDGEEQEESDGEEQEESDGEEQEESDGEEQEESDEEEQEESEEDQEIEVLVPSNLPKSKKSIHKVGKKSTKGK